MAPPTNVTVTITETVTVRPSLPPSPLPHTLPLSHLDNDPNLRTTVRYLRTYPPSSSSSDPFHVITTSLSKALVPFYPLTGTLRPLPNGRLELSYTPTNGLPVVRATADCSLASVNYLDDPSLGFVEALVPDPGPDEALESPFALQVTVFECGGFCLGVAAYNAMCDGQGAALFFGAVVGFAKGLDRVSVEPVWDRRELLGPRDELCVRFPLEEVYGLDKGVLPYGKVSGSGPVRRVCFDVKNEWVERFRKIVLDRSGSSFTTFEALGAFIWRAMLNAPGKNLTVDKYRRKNIRKRLVEAACDVQSSGVAANETVKFAYLISIRKVLNPPLPKGYWGNSCVTMYVPLAAKDLVEQPIWKTADMIKASKANATDEYVRSFIDFQELNYEKGITAGKGVSGFTDWRHLGHSDIDFGWGSPVTVLPLSRQLMGSCQPCFFLPLSVAKGGAKGGFRVMITLEEKIVDDFLEEMERLGSSEFGMSSL